LPGSCGWSERPGRRARSAMCAVERELNAHLALHPHEADGGGESSRRRQLALAHHLALHRHKADGGDRAWME
jgi:hypothetical protein